MRWFGAGLGMLLVATACASGASPTGSDAGPTPSTGAETADSLWSQRTTASVTLGCDEEIVVPEVVALGKPPPGFATILGVVALQTSEVSAEAFAVERDPAGGFGVKSGLMVRAGASVQLLVPEGMRARMRIAWGYAGGKPTWDLTVPGCEGQREQWVLERGDSKWRMFAGGFWVREPACVPLVVRSGAREQRVTIGVGAPCPGQDPPPS